MKITEDNSDVLRVQYQLPFWRTLIIPMVFFAIGFWAGMHFYGKVLGPLVVGSINAIGAFVLWMILREKSDFRFNKITRQLQWRYRWPGGRQRGELAFADILGVEVQTSAMRGQPRQPGTNQPRRLLRLVLQTTQGPLPFTRYSHAHNEEEYNEIAARIREVLQSS
jgi:hypothetical protein